MLYILARTMPRIDDTVLENMSLESPWLNRRIEELDEKIKIISEKWLRRLNITLLKIYNSTHKKLAKMKKESAVGQNGASIFAPKNEGEEQEKKQDELT